MQVARNVRSGIEAAEDKVGAPRRVHLIIGADYGVLIASHHAHEDIDVRMRSHELVHAIPEGVNAAHRVLVQCGGNIGKDVNGIDMNKNWTRPWSA